LGFVTPQLLRYGVTSVIALAADFGTLTLLREHFGLPVLLANSISFTVGLVITFILSRTWVFKSRKVANPWAEFGIFTVIGITGLVVNDAVLWAGTAIGVYYLLAKVVAAGASFVWNYLLRRRLVYG